jgi:Acetokinase family
MPTLAGCQLPWRGADLLAGNPTDAAVLDAAARRAPDVPAVAVFDTVFHRTLPEVAWRYAQERQIARNAVALLRGENTGPGGQ